MWGICWKAEELSDFQRLFPMWLIYQITVNCSLKLTYACEVVHDKVVKIVTFFLHFYHYQTINLIYMDAEGLRLVLMNKRVSYLISTPTNAHT